MSEKDIRIADFDRYGDYLPGDVCPATVLLLCNALQIASDALLELEAHEALARFNRKRMEAARVELTRRRRECVGDA